MGGAVGLLAQDQDVFGHATYHTTRSISDRDVFSVPQVSFEFRCCRGDGDLLLGEGPGVLYESELEGSFDRLGESVDVFSDGVGRGHSGGVRDCLAPATPRQGGLGRVMTGGSYSEGPSVGGRNTLPPITS